MSISASEIQEYTFNPKKPRDSKSYKLLLKLAKRSALIYIGPDFVSNAYRATIDSVRYREELLDIPKNYDIFSINEKINLFKKDNSSKEFNEYIYNLNIRQENFIYNKIFSNFFDITPFNYIRQMAFYSESILKCKITNPKDCDFTGYKLYKNSYPFNEQYQGHKIIFSNENIFFDKPDYFFDVSSVLITTNKDLFIETKKSAVTGKIIMRRNINDNIKPMFIDDEKDIDILLKTLEEDLNNKAGNNIVKEDISTIDKIEIKNFYSIEHIKLENLKDKREIYIVGENGDGKSLLLQAITTSLVGIREGEVFDLLKTQLDAFLYVKDSLGIEYKKETIYKHIFAYGASRYSNCQMKEDQTGYLNLFNNIYDLKNPIKWLQYLDHNEKSEKKNILSVLEAKNLLRGLLNSDIDIEITPDNVRFTERGAEVDFERLSAGYKGIVTITCDLVSRLYERQPYIENIKEFKGIVVIDEVELHLHPKWKYGFMNKLRETFPLIQFIVTTHSPTVILGARKEAVFYKIYKDNGKVKISNQISNEGYTNNSLISSPLFDMETITSRSYTKKISSDDYIYEKIHKVVAEKIKDNINISEDELLNLIDVELDKI